VDDELRSRSSAKLKIETLDVRFNCSLTSADLIRNLFAMKAVGKTAQYRDFDLVNGHMAPAMTTKNSPVNRGLGEIISNRC
jgi:hypothetical protein